MRLIVLSVATLLMGSLFVVYGALLAWRPDLFLKFHDTFVDRSRWNTNAAWRKDVYNLNYKVLGVAFCVVGLFIIYAMLAKLISSQN
jgi:multisubunit Na+/H+ antiporter MnhG subunit